MAPPVPKTRQSDIGAPVVFGVFTAIGVAYIITAKALRADPVMVTSVPVLLMVGYALAVAFLKRLRLRDDQTGDNFYYMGFIFTLTSLAVSLVQYSSGSDVSEIVSNFGVAVASTIAGIVLRIFFNLLRRDPIEVEHVARLELADAAKRVRLELNEVLLELAHFRRTNQQMLEEGFEEVREQVRRSAETSMQSVEQAAKSLETQAAAFAEAGAADKVEAELTNLAGSISGLSATLDEIDAAARRRALRPSFISAIFGRSRRDRAEPGGG